MTISSIRLGIVVIFLATAVKHIAAANSYLGLWGKVFDSSHPGNGSTLADHFQHVADEWKQGTESIHSRIIQRLQSGQADIWNTSSAVPLPDITALVTQLTSPAKIGSIPHINTTINGSTNSSEQLDLFKRLQERLAGVHIGGLDAGQLAVLAALQGLALSSLVKHAATLSAQPQHSWYTKQGSSYAPQPESPKTATHHVGHVGLKLPQSFSGHFKPELCINLQNLGNSPGYRAIYLGSPPCSAKGNDTVFAQVTWGQEAGFLLDCHVGSSDTQEGSSTPTNVGNKIQQAYASELDAMLHPSRTCRLAVAANGSPSSTGGGSSTSSVLKYRQSISAIGRSKWNAIRIRVCNISPTTAQGPIIPSQTGSAALLELQDLKLNGRPVTSADVVDYQGEDLDACRIELLRLPSMALSEAFTITGWLSIHKNNAAFGIGETASIELELGALQLFPTTALTP